MFRDNVNLFVLVVLLFKLISSILKQNQLDKHFPKEVPKIWENLSIVGPNEKILV